MSKRETHEIDGIIERTVLSNTDESGLVVRSRVDRRHLRRSREGISLLVSGFNLLVLESRREYLVHTRRKPTSDIGAENTVVGGFVESLEEGEVLRVGHRSRVELINLLDDDVRVA